MLGNLGYSTIHCNIVPILDNVEVSCEYGFIGNITQLGITNPGMDGNNAANICVVNDNNQKCAPNSNAVADWKLNAQNSQSTSLPVAEFYQDGAGVDCINSQTSLIFV